MKRGQNWRCKGVERIAYCECPALPPEAMVKCQPHASTEGHVCICGYAAAGASVNVHGRIATKDDRTSLVWAAILDHVDVQEQYTALWKAGPTLCWLHH